MGKSTLRDSVPKPATLLSAVGTIVLCNDKEAADEGFEFMTEAAKSFAFSADDSADAFELRSEPFMRWSNPNSSAADGGLFLWPDDDRPTASVKFYQRTDGTWLHNLQSQTTRSFTARRDGQAVGGRRHPGVVWRSTTSVDRTARWGT